MEYDRSTVLQVCQQSGYTSVKALNQTSFKKIPIGQNGNIARLLGSCISRLSLDIFVYSQCLFERITGY